MQYLGIPVSIWLNAVFLVAFAMIVWLRPATGTSRRSAASPNETDAFGETG